jgi:hypothetical protein
MSPGLDALMFASFPHARHKKEEEGSVFSVQENLHCPDAKHCFVLFDGSVSIPIAILNS